VAALPLVAPALLDDEAQIDAASAQDVLDRIPGPGARVGHPVAVQLIGDGGQRVLGRVVPDPPDDGRLLGHDLELVRGRTRLPAASRRLR
jgi:hypothetical protein